jgi:hypothetical protein
MAVHWNVFRGLLGLGALIALIKGVDLLYVVVRGAALSVFTF